MAIWLSRIWRSMSVTARPRFLETLAAEVAHLRGWKVRMAPRLAADAVFQKERPTLFVAILCNLDLQRRTLGLRALDAEHVGPIEQIRCRPAQPLQRARRRL